MNVEQNTKTQSKALSARAVETIKPNDKVKTDVGENTGLRVKRGTKTFFLYRKPEVDGLVQTKNNVSIRYLPQGRINLENFD